MVLLVYFCSSIEREYSQAICKCLTGAGMRSVGHSAPSLRHACWMLNDLLLSTLRHALGAQWLAQCALYHSACMLLIADLCRTPRLVTLRAFRYDSSIQRHSPAWICVSVDTTCMVIALPMKYAYLLAYLLRGETASKNSKEMAVSELPGGDCASSYRHELARN